MSLWGFLKDHYTSEHNDTDQSEDEQLPFKSIIVQPVAFAVMPVVEKTDFTLSFDIPVKSMLPDFYTPQEHLCNIFHPPRA